MSDRFFSGWTNKREPAGDRTHKCTKHYHEYCTRKCTSLLIASFGPRWITYPEFLEKCVDSDRQWTLHDTASVDGENSTTSRQLRDKKRRKEMKQLNTVKMERRKSENPALLFWLSGVIAWRLLEQHETGVAVFSFCVCFKCVVIVRREEEVGVGYHERRARIANGWKTNSSIYELINHDLLTHSHFFSFLLHQFVLRHPTVVCTVMWRS